MVDDFASSVVSKLGSFLGVAGFDVSSESQTRVTFRRADIAVSIAYYIEDLPSPWIAVEIGLVEPDGNRMFGLWRVLPLGSSFADYPSWRFHDEETLDSALVRVLNEILKPYAAELWADRERIERILARQDDEVETRYLSDQRDADLHRARRSFDEGRFQDAIDAYAQIIPTALSARDRRHLHLARQRVRT